MNDKPEENDSISMSAAIPWAIVIAIISWIVGVMMTASSCGVKP